MSQHTFIDTLATVDVNDFMIPYFCHETDKRRFIKQEEEFSKEYLLELFPILKWTKYNFEIHRGDLKS
jgi:hypothetical protein